MTKGFDRSSFVPTDEYLTDDGIRKIYEYEADEWLPDYVQSCAGAYVRQPDGRWRWWRDPEWGECMVTDIKGPIEDLLAVPQNSRASKPEIGSRPASLVQAPMPAELLEQTKDFEMGACR